MGNAIETTEKRLDGKENLATLDVHFDSRLTGLKAVVNCVDQSGAHIIHMSERADMDGEGFPFRCMRMLLKTKDLTHATEILEALHEMEIKANFAVETDFFL